MKKTLIILFSIIPFIVMAQKSAWEEVNIRTYQFNNIYCNYCASSELDGNFASTKAGRYGPHNLFDRDKETAWAEGVDGEGTGEYLIIGVGKYLPDKFLLTNGFQKSHDLYQWNSRPKVIKVSLYTGFFMEGDVSEISSLFRIRKIEKDVSIRVKDEMIPQIVHLPLFPVEAEYYKKTHTADFMQEFSSDIENHRRMCQDCPEIVHFSYFVKLEILETYPGKRWDDACISDIEFLYSIDTDMAIGKDEIIRDIYEAESKEPGLIFIDTDKQEKVILVDRRSLKEYTSLHEGEDLTMILMDVSNDMEWAQVDLILHSEGASRVEESSMLYHVRSQTRIDETLLKTGTEMHGFITEEGKSWLETSDGIIDLDKLLEKMK